MEWLPCDCPNCKEPSVQPANVSNGRAFYRCGGCMWSWWATVTTRDA